MTGRKGKLPKPLILLVSIFAMSTSANEPESNITVEEVLQNCRSVHEPENRLRCYDEVAKRFMPPAYKGKLGKVTDVFELDRPHVLRYRSHGVIFVLYLRDEEGNVLQNLHVGGRGEDKYLIEKPGRYSLKIDGSAGWEIWLEPVL